jgi:hypothetical protein
MNMANYNLRNAQLLSRMQSHPLKKSLAKALDIAEHFHGDVEFLQLDKNLSDAGRRNAREGKLRAAVRDLRDAKAPIGEMQKRLDQKRAAVAIPPFKQDDIVGFLRRQELRAAMRSMERGPRALTLQDPAFADAMLEQPPALSGLMPEENFLVESVKKERLAGLFGPQLAEIDALEQTLAEANSIVNVARNDLKANSGFEQQQAFEEFVKPIEAKQGAPWLRRYTEDGREVIRWVDLEAKVASIATEDQIRDGKFYKDHAEYLADRGAP